VNVKIDAGIIQTRTLPVRLISFTAQPQGDKVALQWKVAEQRNIQSYTVEYSTNGTVFTTLETVAAGTSANAVYNTVHISPVKGANFYRLKINEDARKYNYSDVRKVLFADAGTITVSPNPFMEKIDISISSTSAQNVTIRIADTKGRVVKQHKTAVAAGTSLLPVYNLSSLAPGIYFVRVQSDNSTISFTQKLVKE
jgi:Secretion system C-terminal sorting domain